MTKFIMANFQSQNVYTISADRKTIKITA